MMRSYSVLLVCLYVGYSHAAAEWSYKGATGPENWGELAGYATCANTSQSQSPIDIGYQSCTTEVDATLGELTFTGYDQAAATGAWKLSNNGHTIAVSLENVEATISGGGLTGIYKAAQFHWHWGPDDTVGSEHTINGQAYPMNVHIVHYKSSTYDNLTAAVASGAADALAVLGVKYAIVNDDNAAMKKLVLDNKADIQYKDDNKMIDSCPLNDLLPMNKTYFARYSGSLTTPGCNEIVQWTVFKEPLPVTSAQMKAMRESFYTNKKVEGETDDVMSINYRPVQNLGSRKIKVTHDWAGNMMPHGHDISSAVHAASSAMLMMLSLLIIVW